MPLFPASTQVATDATVTTTTEKIVAQIDNVSVPRPGAKVRLFGSIVITTGTNTTALTPRWRRGTTITDTVVGESNARQVAAAAGSTEELAHSVEDTPGEIAKQSYVLTVQQTAASADGTVVFAEAWADVTI